MDSFTQRDPVEGAAPSQSSVVRVVYDDSALYIGIRLSDSRPEAIGRRLSRRDDEPDADAVQIYLDPGRTGRSGAMFEVTAAGVQRDALIFNDASLDFSWDAVWDSAVSVDERGWTAEIRIPFSQLRFSSGSRWGINVARYVRRNNETDWLVLVPKQDTRIASRMAELDGLDAVHPSRRLEVVSHAVTRDVAGVKTSPTPGALVGAFGTDVKRGLGTNLTADLTVNPDFSQVETDPASVNLTAFEPFLEERRPFFTESAPLFQTFGNAGGAFDTPAPVLFYSRRIGQAPPDNAAVTPLNQPTATPVLAAFKIDGGVGRAWKLAILDALSGATTAPPVAPSTQPSIETAPTTNYAAARLLRSTRTSGFGVLATMVSRDVMTAPSDGAFVPQKAVVGGADAYAFIDPSQQWVIGGQISGSHLRWTPTAGSSDTAAGSASTPATPASTVSVLSAGGARIMRGGPPTTIPGVGPPSGVPGVGPPTSVPGTGPPAAVPAVGPPSATPGAGAPSSVPPGAGSPAADTVTTPIPGTGSLGNAQNTGTSRIVDLSQGRLDGWSGNVNVHRNSGAVRVNLDAWAISPGFEINDLGYSPRADIQGVQAQASWNKFEPDGFTRFRAVGVSKGWARTFAGELQTDTIDVWTSATFLNYWSASAGFDTRGQAFDATATRGGPSIATPAGRSWWASAGTDARAIVSLQATAYHGWNDVGDWSTSAWVGVTVKPTPKITFSTGPTIDRSESSTQYVATIAGGNTAAPAPHYVFATLRAADLVMTTRVSFAPTRHLSLQLYAQPFVATGQYGGFKELAPAAHDRFLRYGTDLGTILYDAKASAYVVQTSNGTSFQIPNPDFTPALLNIHAVARWDWRAGSALYLVWTQSRAGSADPGSANIQGFNGAFGVAADNALAAKITYWFGR